MLDWCVGSVFRVRWVWTFARASFNLMRRCGWTRWSVSLFTEDGDYFTDVTSSFDNVRSAIWSKGILERGVGSCRCWLVPVVLSECRLGVFADKDGSPCRTWLYAFSCAVGLLMSVFIRQISVALASRRNAAGQMEQGRTSNFTLTVAVKRITAYHYWQCILKSMLLWCQCNLTLNPYTL